MATVYGPSYPAYPPPAALIPQRILRPYLGSRARLSLSWLSQHFLALLLVLVALSFLLAQIPTLVREAKESLTAACAGVEGAASVAVSLPHYAADGVNEMNVRAINALSHGAGTVLDLMLQALEAIVLFMIDMYRSLFLCLLDLAVHGSITVLVAGIEEAQEFVTDAMQGLRSTIQSAVSGVNSAIDNTVGLIDKIPGVDFDIPQIDVPELSALENVTLPDTLVNALRDLNSSIPTLDEFRAGLDSLISTPIEALRGEINGTLANSTIEVELLPVPAKETVQLCQDLDTSWVDDVGSGLGSFVKIAIGLVVLAMALFVVANALWERYQYGVFLGGVSAAREAWLADLIGSTPAHETLSHPNLLSFLNASSHPTLFRIVSRLSSFLRLRTPSSRANLIWFLSYIAHPYPWAFLALGLVGLVVVQIQLWVLDGPIRRATRKKAEDGAGEFSTSVMDSLGEKMDAKGREWAEGTNRVIVNVEYGINEKLFGWVNTTTVSLNSTMTGFYSETTDAVTGVFNGTILEDPALGLVYCLIGSKVDAISTALTWLHSNAHLSLPTVSSSVLTLSSNRTDELTASLTDPESSISAPSVADRMIDAYKRSLEQQRLGFIIAIGIWVFVVIMGLVGVWWRACGEEPWRRHRGKSTSGDRSDEKGGDAEFEGGDVEKRAFFRPLHLHSKSRSAFELGDVGGPYEHGASPAAASWASLIDYFKPTPQHDEPTRTAPSPSVDEREPANAPRPLVLPSLALPKLSTPSFHLPTRTRNHNPSTNESSSCTRLGAAATSRLKPLISRPSRPLSRFRFIRDSAFASASAHAGAFARRDRRRDSDAIPLRPGAEVGTDAERRYDLGGTGRQGWRNRIRGQASRLRSRGACETVEEEDEWEEMREEDDGNVAPSRPPAYPPLPSLNDPFADPLRLRTIPEPLQYPPASRPRPVNPFATPFDEA
ncbi:pheromone-regulated protein PRM1 [Rhodotorula paludigena]|uniref:pheromone-regulated protein PRM1 n=1 Tax=Rhodotorula paludigena TaxID=86838 RepID=UPI0031796AE7